MKTVCYLTGVTGWLGGQVARDLLLRGYAVRCLVLPGDKGAKALPAALTQVQGDVRSQEDVARFLELGEQRQRIVIHCAAVITMSIKPVPLVQQVNVQGTDNMLRASLAAQVKRFIYVSSVHALQEQPHGVTIRESKDFDPDKVHGAYAKSKAAATQLVFDAWREEGLPVVVLHPSGICGPDDAAIGNLSQMFIDYFRGRLPMGVEGGYSFCDVRDVAGAVCDAVEMAQPGEGYILASHYVTVREIFDQAAQCAGRKPPRVMLPLWAARMLVPFVGLYYKLKRQKPVLSAYALYTLASNGDFSNEKARQQLGYKPRPFMDTVRDTIQWLKGQGLIAHH